jgi:ABC-type lipoprotein export system ATPase subunit
VLTIKGISKSFHQRGIVLKNLSLEVNEGECISVMGPSGSGKTTLLNLIGLLDKPDSGELLFRGKKLNDFNPDEAAEYRNKNVGFVFQDHHLLPYLTIYENIILPSLAFKNSSEQFASIEKHASDMMKMIGISSLSEKYPFQVSGGEAQRTAIVRALINSPSLILADEPTGSLDSGNGEILGNLLLEMNREFGVTLIVATHSQELAGKMSRKMRLENGKLVSPD